MHRTSPRVLAATAVRPGRVLDRSAGSRAGERLHVEGADPLSRSACQGPIFSPAVYAAINRVDHGMAVPGAVEAPHVSTECDVPEIEKSVSR